MFLWTLDIEELVAEFMTDEIQKAIKSLKRNKFCDLDNNVADFLLMPMILLLLIFAYFIRRFIPLTFFSG